MKKKVIIILAVVACVLLLVVGLYFAWRAAYQIWGGEGGFEAVIVSVEGNVITAEVTKDDDATSFLSPKLPDKIVFDADRCDGSHLKVGDKIRGTYLKGTIDGNNVRVVSVRVYTDPDINSGKRLPIVMTIAETLPSCVAFEYKDGNPYCFYAYDDGGKLYRVLWNNFDGLNEKDRIVVDHNDIIKTLSYDEYPDGGWTPQYEITAISIYSEEEWNAFEQNGANEN